MQQSVQERLEILEGRQQSEEAYLASLQELQEAIVSQSATLQDDIKERMAQLRHVLDEREHYLLTKVKEVEGDKISVIERQREQCISVVEAMRSASRQARQALSDEDPTTWLDNGRHIEQMLTDQNGVKVEYGPSPDLRFGCTLTVDLQRRILEVIDFDEKKGPGSPAKPGALASYKGTPGVQAALQASPFTGSGAGLNQSSVSAINDMVLPDGTDYATFRRSLLAEGVDATTLYRNSLASLARAGADGGRAGGGYGAAQQGLLPPPSGRSPPGSRAP